MSRRFTNAPLRAVVEEGETLDRLDCGHWVKRDCGRPAARRRCHSCPAQLVGARVERKRSEPRPRWQAIAIRLRHIGLVDVAVLVERGEFKRAAAELRSVVGPSSSVAKTLDVLAIGDLK